MKILECFGGIGAYTTALKRLGLEVEIADYIDIDKYAAASFNAINATDFKTQDICEWDKDIEVDLISHGSPCQDFSIIGKQAGGNEGSGTRSSLMYETIRIVKKLKPKYILWENVKNLLSAKHKHNFDNYIEQLRMLGYNSYYQVLNAKDFGVPQNRERVYTISIRSDIDNGFVFPQPISHIPDLSDFLEDNVDEKYYMKESQVNRIIPVKRVLIDKSTNNSHKINVANCITAREDRGISNRKSEGTAVLELTRVRKLTPKECWRLMGFSDEEFSKASKVCSSAQLYKQAGNSICVPVLEAIFKELFKKKIRGDND